MDVEGIVEAGQDKLAKIFGSADIAKRVLALATALLKKVNVTPPPPPPAPTPKKSKRGK